MKEEKSDHERYFDRCVTYHHACACREAAVAKLVEALSFYATGDNWVPARGPDGEPCMSNIWDDAGEIARAALEFHGRKP